MKKQITLILSAVICLLQSCAAQTIYDYKAITLEGDSLDFASFKGKKLIIVNTASKCGLTPQYKQLQSLWETYKDSNLVIIGFPSNDFMKQEPGTSEEIQQFCTKNYGVTFLMMEKITVKGEGIHPIYSYLTQKSLNGLEDNSVKWNFQKYLVGEEGKLELVVDPGTKPNDPKIVEWIRK